MGGEVEPKAAIEQVSSRLSPAHQVVTINAGQVQPEGKRSKTNYNVIIYTMSSLMQSPFVEGPPQPKQQLGPCQ